MAKTLKHKPPTSSVGRLLDASAVARATTSRSTQSPHADQVQVEPLSRLRYVKREFVLTEDLNESFTSLTLLIRRSIGARVTNSHVARSLIIAAVHCLDGIERELNQIGRLKLPPNAKGHEAEREQFERMISSAVLAGMRGSPAMR